MKLNGCKDNGIQTRTAPKKGIPIKSKNDINHIVQFLTREKRFRDRMFFIVGINSWMSPQQLRELKFSSFINEDGNLKDAPLEITDSYIIVRNHATKVAISEYRKNAAIPPTPNDFMFQSESNRGNGDRKPLHRISVSRILDGLSKDTGLAFPLTATSLRNTFAYHLINETKTSPGAIHLFDQIIENPTIFIKLYSALINVGQDKEFIDKDMLCMSINLNDKQPSPTAKSNV